MEDFVQSLLKKDDDAEIIEQTSNSVTIDSSVLVDEIDLALGDDDQNTELETELSEPRMTVPTRVLRTVAMAHTGYTFLILMWGIIPYYFFRSDVGTAGLEWMLLASSVLCCISYGTLAILKDHVKQVVGLAVWMFLLFVCINVLAAILKDLSPFQAVVIQFCQGLVMTVYCSMAKRELNSIWCGGYMAGAGLIAWLAGLVGFMHYNDWITSFVLLLVFVIGSSAYSAWQITLINRFNVSTASQVDAVRHFYVDAILIPIQWIRMKIASYMDRQSTSLSSSPTLERD